ncbi:hypothetical protein OG946_33745 [Streptomyces sp. NBC_01808]|uniref:hypothetical protein n=1 Tax=Streptomyces sp. NBC_01808 TaxID=2975947 RepID=UPI002DDB539C|nr:hypothetical protein [Streptomyces sp. NBC_01808]WSA41905.1 hypothetical protein OG946_33745 [Streptomyces sp. NBC_01808]
MKLRTALGTCLAALALVLPMAGPAQAAQGEFHYKYVDGFGQERQVDLHDPVSGKCINLYGVGDDDVPPGYGPHNDTDTAATVYRGANCTGAEWRLKAHGRPARDALELRSVRFDAPDAP